MIQNLSICHIPKNSLQASEGFADISLDGHECAQQDWLLFETCQRRIYISLDPLNSANSNKIASRFCGGEIYRGQVAYAKLLSVLCGLESKILAETEVFGQFKIFVSALAPDSRFKRIAQDLILDVRELRKSILDGIGLRSYGSISAHYVAGLKSISLIGGGQLAQKILPYLIAGEHEINMHLRSPSKASLLPKRLGENIKTYSLDDRAGFELPKGLIIAAPVASTKIKHWLQATGSSPAVIVDLRDQSADTRLDICGRLITLDDLFVRIEKTSDLLLRKVAKARDEVDVLTKKRFLTRHFRPFGWEDICA
ncbi:MAG: hypothetical protein L3J21_04815 [Devosiaceae bacterium]|nr:hypothetical protein [Devosiaceae bacterium]